MVLNTFHGLLLLQFLIIILVATCSLKDVTGMPRPIFTQQHNTAGVILQRNSTGAIDDHWISESARGATPKEGWPVVPSSQSEQARQNLPGRGKQVTLSQFLQRIKRFSNPCVAGRYVEYDHQCKKAIVKYRCKSDSMRCGVSAQWLQGECKQLWSVLGCSGKKFVSGCECYVH